MRDLCTTLHLSFSEMTKELHTHEQYSAKLDALMAQRNELQRAEGAKVRAKRVHAPRR